MEGFLPLLFFGGEGWSRAERIFWSGVRKGVPSRNKGAYPSLPLPQGRLSRHGVGHPHQELLSSVNLWLGVWLRAAQTERGNARHGATKKREISRTLLSINLHFSVQHVAERHSAVRIALH